MRISASCTIFANAFLKEVAWLWLRDRCSCVFKGAAVAFAAAALLEVATNHHTVSGEVGYGRAGVFYSWIFLTCESGRVPETTPDQSRERTFSYL
jgi:hypothetical protein